MSSPIIKKTDCHFEGAVFWRLRNLTLGLRFLATARNDSILTFVISNRAAVRNLKHVEHRFLAIARNDKVRDVKN
jgi:hypothetical protein